MLATYRELAVAYHPYEYTLKVCYGIYPFPAVFQRCFFALVPSIDQSYVEESTDW